MHCVWTGVYIFLVFRKPEHKIYIGEGEGIIVRFGELAIACGYKCYSTEGSGNMDTLTSNVN